MIIKLDKDYDVKCTLGTIKDIETRFSKPFYTLVSMLDKLTTTEQIKLLFVGAKRANANITENEFITACEDNLGLGELTEYLEQFVLQLQYPGLTNEEVQQKIEKKLVANQKMQNVRNSTGKE